MLNQPTIYVLHKLGFNKTLFFTTMLCIHSMYSYAGPFEEGLQAHAISLNNLMYEGQEIQFLNTQTWRYAYGLMSDYTGEGWAALKTRTFNSGNPKVTASIVAGHQRFKNTMTTLGDHPYLHATNLFGTFFIGMASSRTELARSAFHVQAEASFRSLHLEYRVKNEDGSVNLIATSAYNEDAIGSSKILGQALYSAGLAVGSNITKTEVAVGFLNAGIGSIATSLADQLSLIPTQRAMGELDSSWGPGSKSLFFLTSRALYALPITAAALITSTTSSILVRGEYPSGQHLLTSVLTGNSRQLMYAGTVACKLLLPGTINRMCDVGKHVIALQVGTFVGRRLGGLGVGFSEPIGTLGRRRMYVEDRASGGGVVSFPGALRGFSKDLHEAGVF
ncbi:MAG: hypothetical protein ACI8VC_002597 [Candidatus Endobugula sp.]|jgi:hypothetical protein